MQITEFFYSIQGEGPAMGKPCFFIRFAGCNLRCKWCDTPQSSWNPVGASYTLAEVLEKAKQYKGAPVVITGGEPFIQGSLTELCHALRKQGHAVHLETAGTVFQAIEADLICISPKLANSVPDKVEYPQWHAQHERLREAPIVIEKFLQRWPEQVYFKFVVESEPDLVAIREYLERIDFRQKFRVYLMPQGKTRAALDTLGPQIVEWCLREGYSYSDRLHVRLWENQVGR